MSSVARYCENDLKLVETDEQSLQQTLGILQASVVDAVRLIIQHAEDDGFGEGRDSVYTGNSGIVLMLLRLLTQLNDAGLNTVAGLEDLPLKVSSLIERLLSSLKVYHMREGHVSPLCTHTGPALMHILVLLAHPSTFSLKEGSTDAKGERQWKIARKTVKDAIVSSCEMESSYGEMDEALYGRAGLLWAILNLRLWLDDDTLLGLSAGQKQELHSFAGDNVVDEIFTEIIESGDTGASICQAECSEYGFPLVWKWHGRLYLGAMHGMAGILAVLFQSPRRLVEPQFNKLTDLVSALCRIVVDNDGHLPSSVPAHPGQRRYVQLCHGSPGLLLLLSTLRLRFAHNWNEEWNQAEKTASDVIWQEGLVTKGLGVCHGVSGNAWPWLLQATARQGSEEGDQALSRALAFLLHARGLPPMPSPDDEKSPYRTPDNPYSLFEGLSGTICAWLDACVLIRQRISAPEEKVGQMLGIPGLGGTRAHGLL